MRRRLEDALLLQLYSAAQQRMQLRVKVCSNGRLGLLIPQVCKMTAIYDTARLVSRRLLLLLLLAVDTSAVPSSPDGFSCLRFFFFQSAGRGRGAAVAAAARVRDLRRGGSAERGSTYSGCVFFSVANSTPENGSRRGGRKRACVQLRLQSALYSFFLTLADSAGAAMRGVGSRSSKLPRRSARSLWQRF